MKKYKVSNTAMQNMIRTLLISFAAFAAPGKYMEAQVKQAKNPIIFADVPDMSMVRTGNTYYMSSTTMHMSPGVPIMKSKDLANWQLINYAYDTLADIDA